MHLGRAAAAARQPTCARESQASATTPLSRAPLARASRTRVTLTRARADGAAPTWLRINDAAAILGMEVVTLRRAIERNARLDPEGRMHADFDGVRARKIGRHWRVFLAPCWSGHDPA